MAVRLKKKEKEVICGVAEGREKRRHQSQPSPTEEKRGRKFTFRCLLQQKKRRETKHLRERGQKYPSSLDLGAGKKGRKEGRRATFGLGLQGEKRKNGSHKNQETKFMLGLSEQTRNRIQGGEERKGGLTGDKGRRRDSGSHANAATVLLWGKGRKRGKKDIPKVPRAYFEKRVERRNITGEKRKGRKSYSLHATTLRKGWKK